MRIVRETKRVAEGGALEIWREYELTEKEKENDRLYFMQQDKKYRALIGQWREVSESEYYEMQDILPPIFKSGGFFVMEALYKDLHHFFIRKGKGDRWNPHPNDRFFKSVFSLNEKAEVIKDSLEAFLKKGAEK